MIDYSVCKKFNLMDETAAPKAYAVAQIRENMSFSDFVNHIAGHNGVFSRGTVQGVLSDACQCLVEQLLNGNKVQLGELGKFWISLSSTGADSPESFSASNIKNRKHCVHPRARLRESSRKGHLQPRLQPCGTGGHTEG